jgi:DNA-binding transcriptional MerR regulator
MNDHSNKPEKPEPVVLPPIPAKRYFTLSEVSDLCAVKPHVLRCWEQEFIQLQPAKRRGNRRYYQRHEILLIRRIRALLYEDEFTIGGVRNQLGEQDNGVKNEMKKENCLSKMPVENTNIKLLAIRDELVEVLIILKPALRASL